VTVTLRGSAKLEDYVHFAVAGLKTDESPPIKFSLQAEARADLRWRAMIGFHPHDWETETQDAVWVQAYCPPPSFDHIITAVRTGRVEKLRVVMETWSRTDLEREREHTRESMEQHRENGRHVASTPSS
jgi:hypothetical protein